MISGVSHKHSQHDKLNSHAASCCKLPTVFGLLMEVGRGLPYAGNPCKEEHMNQHTFPPFCNFVAGNACFRLDTGKEKKAKAYENLQKIMNNKKDKGPMYMI